MITRLPTCEPMCEKLRMRTSSNSMFPASPKKTSLSMLTKNCTVEATFKREAAEGEAWY